MKYKINDIVKCFKGSKSGIGKIIDIWNNSYLVEFPHVEYPLSMSIIDGQYYIPEEHIIKKVEEEG